MAATNGDSVEGLSTADHDAALPRVLIVSRRCVRKNKFVDFVGEYHLDLLVSYGAAPVIVPRVSGIDTLLPSFEPIHGVLLCEGEDIDPSHYHRTPYSTDTTTLSPDELDTIRAAHASDTAIDPSKDAIELRLARLCVDRGAPFLGICRGSQVLNVACGGTLYADVESELHKERPGGGQVVKHMDYGNYDGHRHGVSLVERTPVARWFESEGSRIMVNSYHHQGVRRLAKRFVPMAYADDGLVEGFYDPDMYCPEEGKFAVGLQFHPERMRKAGSDEFDYPGCPAVYKDFVTSVAAYKRKLDNCAMASVPRGIELTLDVAKNGKVIFGRLSVPKSDTDPNNLARTRSLECQQPKAGRSPASFIEQDSSALNPLQQRRLNQVGATVRNAGSYLQRLKIFEDRERLARTTMAKMSVQQLSELQCLYTMMAQVCSEVIDSKTVQQPV